MKTIKQHNIDENKIMTNYYETNYNYKLTIYNNYINNEPLKILKKRHKEWENKKNKLQEEVNTAYNDLLDSYKSIEKTL